MASLSVLQAPVKPIARLSVNGIAYDVFSADPGDLPGTGLHLSKINGHPIDAVVILDTDAGAFCSCELDYEQTGRCAHVAAARAAGLLPTKSAYPRLLEVQADDDGEGSETAPAVAPRPSYHSLADASRNGPWAGYSDTDLEEMASYYSQV